MGKTEHLGASAFDELLLKKHKEVCNDETGEKQAMDREFPVIVLP